MQIYIHIYTYIYTYINDTKITATLTWHSLIFFAEDHCASSPCQNGGTCSVLPTTFKCACVCGWGGDTCSDCGCSGGKSHLHCI